MCKIQSLRAALKERLGEIMALFESSIAEYEEALSRSEKENQRRQQLLDSLLNPRVVLLRAAESLCPVRDVQTSTQSPCSSLIQDVPQTAQVKEEQEEEPLPVPAPDSSALCMKTVESSPLQHRQTEAQEETHQEAFSSETEGHWEPLFSRSAAQTETEADGDHHRQVQETDRNPELFLQDKSAPTPHNGDTSTPEGETENHPCSVCKRAFFTKKGLKRHFRTHSGEKPFRCSKCKKAFTRKGNLDAHMKTHTSAKPVKPSAAQMETETAGDPHNQIQRRGRARNRQNKSTPGRSRKEHPQGQTRASSSIVCTVSKVYPMPPAEQKPDMSREDEDKAIKKHQCPFCPKSYWLKKHLKKHTRVHEDKKSFSCSICSKAFRLKSQLRSHLQRHTGEKPHSCPVCSKAFYRRSDITPHLLTHTGVRPFSCSYCERTFTQKVGLQCHLRAHTGEKPFVCPICKKCFKKKYYIKVHMETHKKPGVRERKKRQARV